MSAELNMHPVSEIHFSNGLRTKLSNFLGLPAEEVLMDQTKDISQSNVTYSPVGSIPGFGGSA